MQAANHTPATDANVPIFLNVLGVSEDQSKESLSAASTSSAESLQSIDNGVERPAVTLRSSRVPGAFTSYIRKRGEPDGRTACSSDSTSKVSITAHVGKQERSKFE